MAAPAPSRVGPFPDLSIDDFLYGHEGPWPQPSRDHPFGLAPGIYQIPKAEWDDWSKYVGNYYLEKAAPFGVKAAEIALHDARETDSEHADIADADFNTLVCEGLYSKFLSAARSARRRAVQAVHDGRGPLRLLEVRLQLHARGQGDPSGRSRGRVGGAGAPAEERHRIQLRGGRDPAAALEQGQQAVRDLAGLHERRRRGLAHRPLLPSAGRDPPHQPDRPHRGPLSAGRDQRDHQDGAAEGQPDPAPASSAHVAVDVRQQHGAGRPAFADQPQHVVSVEPVRGRRRRSAQAAAVRLVRVGILFGQAVARRPVEGRLLRRAQQFVPGVQVRSGAAGDSVALRAIPQRVLRARAQVRARRRRPDERNRTGERSATGPTTSRSGFPGSRPARTCSGRARTARRRTRICWPTPSRTSSGTRRCAIRRTTRRCTR